MTVDELSDWVTGCHVRMSRISGRDMEFHNDDPDWRMDKTQERNGNAFYCVEKQNATHQDIQMLNESCGLFRMAYPSAFCFSYESIDGLVACLQYVEPK